MELETLNNVLIIVGHVVGFALCIGIVLLGR